MKMETVEDMTPPKIGRIYEFVNYDGKPATLRVVNVTESFVWYQFNERIALHVYPMAIELWNNTEYKIIA